MTMVIMIFQTSLIINEDNDIDNISSIKWI